MTVPTHREPEDAPARDGVAQFMTVDAFDVTVAAGNADAAVVVKDHSGPLPDRGRTVHEHRAAMERERNWLRAAAGIPGVVRLVEDPENPHTVVTEFGGSRTLRSHCPGPSAAARALACVAETVAALSARGIVHGSIEPEHVILTTDGSAVLCSPNSSTTGNDDLVSLGKCIEFATEQWERPPASLTRWLLLAKQLRDQDPTMGPERAARILRELIDPDRSPARRRLLRPFALVSLVVAALVLAAGMLYPSSTQRVDGPQLEIEGMVVRVGRQGDIAIVRPSNPCTPARIYLLEPVTFQIWTFDRFQTGGTATPTARVPGATTLELSDAVDGCFSVLASGPAGEVALP